MKLVEILVKLEEYEIPNNTKFKWGDRLVINKKGTLYCDGVYFSKILNFGNAESLKENLEIIEEDKPTEELDLIEKINNDLHFSKNYSKNNMESNGKYLADKINQLVDEVNKLKKEKENE